MCGLMYPLKRFRRSFARFSFEDYNNVKQTRPMSVKGLAHTCAMNSHEDSCQIC